jgi:hemerythrin
MAALYWNDSYSVKIDTIDKQHKKLFKMVNDFYDNINKRPTNEIILKLIHDMKMYTVMHFSTEESYMKRYKYPNYEIHKKEHDEFIDKVITLEERLKNGIPVLSFEITNFLKNWIKEHIQKTDMQYSDFLVKHGVS